MMRSHLFTAMKLHDAVSLNEEGVRSLGRCQIRDALHFFQRALEALHELEMARPNSATSTSVREPLPNIWSSAVIPQLRNDNFYVYQQALLFSPVKEGTSVSSNHLRFYSAATAFNLGLTFHLKGVLQTSSNTSSSFQKAALCYKQALQDMNTLQVNLNNNTTSTAAADTNSTMIQLLALNNHCQINYQLGNVVELRGGLEQIRKLSPTVLLRSVFCSSQQGVIGELMLNVLVSSNEPVNAAAAA